MANSDPSVFLGSLVQFWDLFIRRVRLLSHIFLYLDRVYVLSRPELCSVYDFCVDLFREKVINDKLNILIYAKLNDSIKSMVSLHRNFIIQFICSSDKIDLVKLNEMIHLEHQNTIDSVRRTLRMLQDVGIMDSVFQEILSFTAEFYARISLNLSKQYSSVLCLEKMSQALDGDKILFTDCYRLEPQLAEILQKNVLNSTFIHRFVPTVEGVLEDICNTNTTTLGGAKIALTTLNGLCKRAEVTKKFRDLWSIFIRTKGLVILQSKPFNFSTSQSEASVEKTSDILGFKERLDRLLATSLDADSGFSDSLKDSFEWLMNMRAGLKRAPVEMLATFLDSLLKSGSSNSTTDADLQATLDRAISLFRHVQSKDVFETHYKRDLARRLLQGRCLSQEAELGVVERLRRECGVAYTSRIEAMFRDIESSKSLSSAFLETQRTLSAGPKRSLASLRTTMSSRFVPTVITSGIWPGVPQSWASSSDGSKIETRTGKSEGESGTIKVLQWVEEAQQEYAAFYESQHKGRKLRWNQELGSVVLRMRLGPGIEPKELYVSVAQAVVLSKFNDVSNSEGLIFESLLNLCEGMRKEELTSTLKSLTHRVAPILTLTNNIGDIKADETQPTTDDNGILQIKPNIDIKEKSVKKDYQNEHSSRTNSVLIDSNTVINVNSNFISKHARIRLLGISAEDSSGPSDMAFKDEIVSPTMLVVDANSRPDRQYVIDAAIVRIMKSQKRCRKDKLADQMYLDPIFGVSKIRIEPAELASRIESLMQREYISVDSDDRDILVYLV